MSGPAGRVLVSFDIDGTLEIGDPPGEIGLEVVRRARRLGYVVGSSSDRVVSDQQHLWAAHGVEVDFVGHKHHLDQLKDRYPDIGRWIHIGDTYIDEHYASIHGFEFYFAEALPDDGDAGWVF